MTPVQEQVLDFVRERIVRAELPPLMREIAAHIGRPQSVAHDIVNRLVGAGHLRRRAGVARGLALPNIPDLRTVDTAILRAELTRRGEAGGAFAPPRRYAFGRGDGACAADGCQLRVERGQAFCDHHWANISRDTRNAFLTTNRIATRTRQAEDIAACQEAFGHARDEAGSRSTSAGGRV